MSAIDDLIAQIEDRALRERLREETSRITKEKKFGLVFEEHLPERTPLYNAKIVVGSRVAKRGGDLSKVWVVLSLSGEQALCIEQKTGKENNFSIDEIMVVADFEEPIFPALRSMDKVQNGDDNDPWHTLIEADNFHALQLLEYLYNGQVDCIYIDPPYNTGARDWKYNNDYVDSNDSWRHSKWLAMMEKRLRVAKRILAKDGTLIVTIDDNEHAHLTMLLNEIFPERKLFNVPIQHNPRGTQGEKFAVTHETAIFVVSKSGEIYKRNHLGDEASNFRKWGNQSKRSQTTRATTFYPVIIDEHLNIIKFGDVLPPGEHPAGANVKIENRIYIYPIDINGIERKWRYSKVNEEEVLPFLKAVDNSGVIEIHIQRETENTKTIWTDPLYNAEEYGTKMINKMLDVPFSYPKSLYAVRDSLWHIVSGKPKALIIDFFAGSGTTLNAVNLLNAEDGGQRRCIMVTNNEVSEGEAKSLRNKGFLPGDTEWEKHGICQAVTWVRSKYSILGKRDDGSYIDGEYITGKVIEKEKQRNFYHIDFSSSDDFTTAARKKRFIKVIEGIPQSLVKPDSTFILSENERHYTSVLFDDTQVNAWLDALADQEHITDFYIITERPANFNSIKDQINELLGPMIITEEEKRPMKDGFAANLEYFRLEFLDKDQVALGKQFREILPILWLGAGAVGPRPILLDDSSIPVMLIPDKNSFAVLVDEAYFTDFLIAIESRTDLTHVFLVTDSEEAFQEMASQIKVPQVTQLYKDYIENFAINKGGK